MLFHMAIMQRLFSEKSVFSIFVISFSVLSCLAQLEQSFSCQFLRDYSTGLDASVAKLSREGHAHGPCGAESSSCFMVNDTCVAHEKCDSCHNLCKNSSNVDCQKGCDVYRMLNELGELKGNCSSDNSSIRDFQMLEDHLTKALEPLPCYDGERDGTRCIPSRFYSFCKEDENTTMGVCRSCSIDFTENDERIIDYHNCLAYIAWQYTKDAIQGAVPADRVDSHHGVYHNIMVVFEWIGIILVFLIPTAAIFLNRKAIRRAIRRRCGSNQPVKLDDGHEQRDIEQIRLTSSLDGEDV